MSKKSKITNTSNSSVSSIYTGLSNTTGTITTSGTAIGAIGGITYTPYTSSWSDPLDYLEGKAINLKKVEEMSEERRKIFLSLLTSLSSANDTNVKKLILNTIESYNLLEDKDVLTRKAKIESVTK